MIPEYYNIKNELETADCINRPDANKLYNIINSALDRKTRIQLDFCDVTSISMSFIQNCFAQLLRTHSRDKIQILVRVVNLNEKDIASIRHTLNISAAHYRVKKQFDRKTSNIMKKLPTPEEIRIKKIIDKRLGKGGGKK